VNELPSEHVMVNEHPLCVMVHVVLLLVLLQPETP
jgi:hypothetical protein